MQARLGRWSGFAGVRVDHYDDLGTHPTAYGGLAYAATRTLTLRASAGNTYRAPALHELFFIPFFGQPKLEPERSVGADLGIDWTPTPAGRLSLTGYYSRLDDLIQLTFAQRLGLFVSENVAEARIWGFEVEGECRWGPGFDSGFDYTYADSPLQCFKQRAYRMLCLRFAYFVRPASTPPRCKTRYGWAANPYPTGTLTLQDAASLSQRDNARTQGRADQGTSPGVKC